MKNRSTDPLIAPPPLAPNSMHHGGAGALARSRATLCRRRLQTLGRLLLLALLLLYAITSLAPLTAAGERNAQIFAASRSATAPPV